MAPKTFVHLFEPRRLLDNTTISVRTLSGHLHLCLTLEDGREASRPVTKEVAEAYWVRGRHFVVEDALNEMRAELGKAR